MTTAQMRSTSVKGLGTRSVLKGRVSPEKVCVTLGSGAHPRHSLHGCMLLVRTHTARETRVEALTPQALLRRGLLAGVVLLRDLRLHTWGAEARDGLCR